MAELLYHYCPTPTAFAILQTRTFRLSALSAANDSLEGRVLGRVFSGLLTAAGLPKGVEEVVSIIVRGYADATEGFAFCLSENGDLLSQWRAYARDGTGISIGFSSEVLAKDFGQVNFGSGFCELVKVDYGEAALKESLSPYVDEMKSAFAEDGEFVRLRNGLTPELAQKMLADRQQGVFEAVNNNAADRVSDLLKILSPLHFRIYGTKPLSFHEEREWRLLRYAHRAALGDIRYCADDFSVRPFIPCLIADPAREAVQEVILGPKHRSDIDWMRAFLGSVGMPHVRVLRSGIESYR